MFNQVTRKFNKRVKKPNQVKKIHKAARKNWMFQDYNCQMRKDNHNYQNKENNHKKFSNQNLF